MALKYAVAGLVGLALLFFIFAGAEWQLPGRDASLILIALAFGFYIIGSKIDALRRD